MTFGYEVNLLLPLCLDSLWRVRSMLDPNIAFSTSNIFEAIDRTGLSLLVFLLGLYSSTRYAMFYEPVIG